MGGRYFTISCTLSRNGYRIKTSVLINTGVNGFTFMNTSFAVELVKFLNLKVTRLPKIMAVKGFDGKHANIVSHVLILHLTIDRRR